MVKVGHDIDVVVIGHIIIETIIFPNGSVLTPVLGSPAAYSSVALARLGCRVGLCTKVGKDMPAPLSSVFEKAGVDLRGFQITDGYSTKNRLVYRHMEQKRVEYVTKAPNFSLHDIPEAYQGAALFYVCPMDFEIPVEVVDEIAGFGRPIFVDLGGYGGATSSVHQFGESELVKRLIPLLQRSSVVKASLEDCGLILGESGPNGSITEMTFAKKLTDLGATIVVITLGSRGVCLYTPSGGTYFPPFRCVAIDTTGAGDTFCAGMIYEYLKVQDISRAIPFGEAVACLVIEKTGGVSVERMPTEREVRAFMSNQINGKREGELS